MKNNLPKYWAVKNDGSQLFKDTVIAYLYQEHGEVWTGNLLYYYGYDGNGGFNGTDCQISPHAFLNNPTILSIEEFIKLSKPIKMKLPEKWCVKVSSIEDYRVDAEAKGYDLNNAWILERGRRGDKYFYYSDDGTSVLPPSFVSLIQDDNYLEITFEMFQQYLKNTYMDKKIIGYKCPTDLYGGQVKAGTSFKPTSSTPTPTPVFVAVDENDKVIKSHFELPKEIVEQWEPLYDETIEFKVGDWVICQFPSYNEGEEFIGKLTVLDYFNNKQDAWVEEHGIVKGKYTRKSYKYVCVSSSIIRKATTDEVKDYLIKEAKEKSLWNVPIYHAGETVKGRPGYNEYYDAKLDKLWSSYGLVYWDGKWATPVVQEKTISVGGKFDVTIKDGKIRHRGDDITAFVEEMMEYFKPPKFGGYTAQIKSVEFSQTGCQYTTTSLQDWQEVYAEWKKFNNMS